jgi:predicted PurR-regulated permease PerM
VSEPASQEDAAGGLPAAARPRVVWAAGASTLALAGAVLILWRAREVIGWLGVALLLALALGVPARALQSRGLARGTAIAIVLVAAGGTFVTLVLLLAPRLALQAHALVEDLPAIGHRLDRNSPFPWVTEHLHQMRQLGEGLAAHAGGAAGSVLHLLRAASRTVFATVTVFVLAAYMLVSGPALVTGALSWLPAERRPRWEALASTIRWVVGRYVAALFFRAAVLGALSAIVLALLHVPYFLPLGFILTLLGVLPIIGPILGGVLMTGAAAVASGPHAGLIALGFFVVVQQADSHLLSPLVQRRTVQMNPLVTVIAGLVGVTAGGVLGGALALPLTAVVQIVLRERRGQRARPPNAIEPRPAAAAIAPEPAFLG